MNCKFCRKNLGNTNINEFISLNISWVYCTDCNVKFYVNNYAVSSCDFLRHKNNNSYHLHINYVFNYTNIFKNSNLITTFPFVLEIKPDTIVDRIEKLVLFR